MPARPTAANLQQQVCLCGSMLGQTDGWTQTMLCIDTMQAVLNIKILNFDLSLDIKVEKPYFKVSHENLVLD